MEQDMQWAKRHWITGKLEPAIDASSRESVIAWLEWCGSWSRHKPDYAAMTLEQVVALYQASTAATVSLRSAYGLGD